MSDGGEEDQETYSGHVMKKEQRAISNFIKNNTVPIITANLHEASSYDAVNCSIVAR